MAVLACADEPLALFNDFSRLFLTAARPGNLRGVRDARCVCIARRRDAVRGAAFAFDPFVVKDIPRRGRPAHRGRHRVQLPADQGRRAPSTTRARRRR